MAIPATSNGISNDDSNGSNNRTIITSVKYHVQQWINLVLYNSIYQNLVLLYLYRLFKFLYGFFDRTTELSRICGANNWPTPLDPLWDDEGHVTSTLVNDKHLGTIAYTTAATAVRVQLRTPIGTPANGGGGRQSSIQHQALANSHTTDRNSTDSARSVLSSQDSGSDGEKRTLVKGSSSVLSRATTAATVVDDGQELSSSSTSSSLQDNGSSTGVGDRTREVLKHRKQRSVSTASTSSHTSSNGSGTSGKIKMDLRQSRSAAGMVYRIDRCILFSKHLTLERRELEAADCDPTQITQQILRKKRFPDGGSPNSPAAKKLQYALDRIALTHHLAREINQR
ncbi:hypothetical protein BGZ98_002568, partial [Dissophora globulifera]